MERRKPAEQAGPDPVLVVGGDRDYSKFVTDVLQRAGFATQQAETGEEALALARERRPAAVVLEVILPGAPGYETCRALREEHGENLPIVFISGERTEAADRVVGLLIGGDDYIVKPIDPDELTVRLRRLIGKAATVRTEPARLREGFSALTSRESEVLRLLALGLNQDDIARNLDISPATVGTHIQRILTKLDVHSRTQAVALAYRERLVGEA